MSFWAENRQPDLATLAAKKPKKKKKTTLVRYESNAVSLSFLRVYICFLWWILGLQYRNVRWKHMHLKRGIM